MAKAKILIVDDETRWAQSGFLEELKLCDYEVLSHTDVDEALAYLDGNLDSIDVLILDIMMPPGKSFEGATDQGLDTGIQFYDKIRLKAPHLPIIIFTNVTSKEMAQKFLNETDCWFYPKIDVFPFELVEEIEEILADKREPK
jgi:CheY-like chemotaxis protein